MTLRWVLVALVIAIGSTGCAGSFDEAVQASTAAQPSGRSTAAATPSAEGMVGLPKSPPIRMEVPSIGVDSSLLDLGLQDDGSLEVPPDGTSAGWYTGAPTPGELGPAVIAGHVDWDGDPGVFHRLRDLQPGEEISVFREDGTVAFFRVTRVEQFAKDEFPTETVYGDIDHAGLRLITCGGSFDGAARSYDDNIVVFAEFDRVARV
jgi:sortase (surface protein transpeptidase)